MAMGCGGGVMVGTVAGAVSSVNDAKDDAIKEGNDAKDDMVQRMGNLVAEQRNEAMRQVKEQREALMEDVKDQVQTVSKTVNQLSAKSDSWQNYCTYCLCIFGAASMSAILFLVAFPPIVIEQCH